MLQINDGPPTTHQAQGQALNSGAELLLYDAEVPREGVHVTRAGRRAGSRDRPSSGPRSASRSAGAKDQAACASIN
jgi:hypothetical protein